MSENDKKYYLPDIIGQGYGEFWRTKKRYVVCKGSRASKKSKTTALWIVVNMMKFPMANTLCVRKTERTLLNSCYSDIQWACERLGVTAYWNFTKNPLEITYKPHGNKILFRGCEDVLKLTSISVPRGNLCWCWIEEAYQLDNPDIFQTIDESIRGELDDPNLFKRIMLTFNPWSAKTWIKARFFDKPDEDTYAFTTNYMVNEWLDDADRKVFEKMKVEQPNRYRVSGLGDWGLESQAVFEENWEEWDFTMDDLKEIPDLKESVGMDFGFTDPSVVLHVFVSNKRKEIYVWDEWYQAKATNEMIYNAAVNMGLKNKIIYADSAAPKDIADLRSMGLEKIRGARKGNDSKLHNIRKVQECRVFIKPRCVNLITEMSLYAWQKDKFGNFIDKPVDGFDHAVDSLFYSVSDILRGSLFSFD